MVVLRRSWFGVEPSALRVGNASDIGGTTLTDANPFLLLVIHLLRGNHLKMEVQRSICILRVCHFGLKTKMSYNVRCVISQYLFITENNNLKITTTFFQAWIILFEISFFSMTLKSSSSSSHLTNEEVELDTIALLLVIVFTLFDVDLSVSLISFTALLEEVDVACRVSDDVFSLLNELLPAFCTIFI